MKRRHALLLSLLALLSATATAGDGDKPAAPLEAPKPADISGFWTEDELRRIDEGLDVVNASRADLGFQKQPIDDPFRLPAVRRALEDPLSVGREAAEWDAAARATSVQIDTVVLKARHVIGAGGDWAQHQGEPDDVVAAVVALGSAFPAAARQRLSWLTWDILGTITAVDATFGPIESEQRRSLLRKALLSQVEKPAIAPADTEISDADFLARVQKVGLSQTEGRGCGVSISVDRLVKELRPIPRELLGAPRDPVRAHTPRGDVVLYGTGDDVHPADEDAILVIDLGGNDTYLRGASANLLENRPVQVVIDLTGDDRYVGGNDFSCGGALGGIAVNWDCGGNDVYIAGNCSLGAGILGVGVLVDEGGDDVFRAKDFCEGAGAFGIGVLLKKGGNDLYHADLYGQGYATTWGCGVLVDLAGNDTYDAGGAHVDLPLYRDRYQALSQGFAIGMRPDASGGVGVLVDVSGNDRYATDIYGQGSSYWYSLGLLIDDDGNDTYNGVHYCQGTGIHLSAGMLLDRAGSDSYYCLNGVGIGGSHDFAVGFLVDRAGDDYYCGSGASQGCGHTNGVGILLDDAGDDGYSAVHGLTQGDASVVRSTGGIGLLLDGAGKDVYSEQTRDEGVWIRGVVGAGVDEPSPPIVGGEPQSAAISKEDATKKVETEGMTAKDGGAPQWDLDKLWKIAAEWEVNDNRIIIPIAKERLWALGAPALDRAFERLMTVAVGSGVEFRAVDTTIQHFAEGDGRAAVVARLLDKTKDADVNVRKGAVAVIASLKPDEALPRLLEMLAGDEPLRRGVLAALGALKKAPPAVVAMVRSPKELEGVNAAVCLGAVADDASVAALVAALGPDVKFLVRTCATEQLAGLPEKAIVALSKLARDEKAPAMARRNALRALGKGAHPDAVDPIVDSFLSPDRWVRLSAYQAARAMITKANEADRTELSVSLEAAMNLEKDPLLRRFR